jgi:hypothetical protein
VMEFRVLFPLFLLAMHFYNFGPVSGRMYVDLTWSVRYLGLLWGFRPLVALSEDLGLFLGSTLVVL